MKIDWLLILFRLDKKTQTQVQTVVQTLFRDYTILMVAHRLDSIVGFDRVIVFDQGKVVEDGCPQQLLADKRSVLNSFSTSW